MQVLSQVGGRMNSLHFFVRLALTNFLAQMTFAPIKDTFKKSVCVLIRAFSLSVIASSLLAADQPYKAFVKSIEHQYFVLRAQESLCRKAVAWDQRRIWECRLTKAGSSIAIEGVADWEGRYFVS